VLLHLDTILDEPVDIDAPLELGELTLDGQRIAVGEAHLSGVAERTERGVELRARLAARLALDCVRCLEPGRIDLDVPVLLTLVPDTRESGALDQELNEADATLYFAPAGRVDLAHVASEQIYLNVPLKQLCRPDCRGLCPACGANRNRLECGCRQEATDPRLAPLLEFRKTLDRS
jgi:uncharacterized protein